MPRQRRKKPEAAASKARPGSPRSTRPRRRGRAGAGEPEAEAEQPGPRRPVSGGSLPGSARPRSPRRSRKPGPQNGVRVEVLAQGFLRRRFPGLGCLLERLRDKVHLLRRRQPSVRTTVGLGIFVGVMHWIHLSILFENDRHFSHLSSLEREMTFRTEMGLYYSYFKTIIQAPSFLEGLWTIMNDRLTEYPLVINTVKRFHLYPEVILAFWYRTFVGIMNVFGIETKTCWNVTRVQPLSEVQSCEGAGDPACFYVGVIFILNGVMMSMFFIYGACLSGTHFGGLITVLCYFFNHGEATRVMWTPPLRESFSYPFLVLQMCILTLILRLSHSSGRYYIALCLSNVAFMLPWQFAQFILFTQIASLFPMYVVGYIEPNKFKKIIYMNMISVLLCFVLMFGNSLYLSSYYSSSLLMTWVIILKRNNIQRLGVSELNFWKEMVILKPKNQQKSRSFLLITVLKEVENFSDKLLKMTTEDSACDHLESSVKAFAELIQCFGWFCGTIILKFLTSKILGVSDHIRLSDLIAARILRFTDFDTLIYTCAPEFGFMEKATPVRYIRTLLLPLVMVITYFILKKTFRDVLCVLCTNTYQRKQLLEHGELIFHTLQLLAFTALAILIMRLKLFLTPHMCVMASLICSRRLFGWLFYRVRFENIIFGLLTVMSIQGFVNLRGQWSILGEFNNLPQEELIEWIKSSTRADAVFAGAMPTMASVKLSTLRPIVNHPHYEDADLRARTKIVYGIYSRKSAKEVRDKLLQLHVNYYILEEAWCVVRTKPGCSMLEIWDLEDPSNAANPPLCSALLQDARPYFTVVFQNSMYRVLKVA